jgi:hypothetical protein
MAKPITYNQIIEVFRTVANKHLQIHHFGHGMIEDVNTFQQEDDKFPVLWVVPQSTRLTDNSTVYRMRVLVFDIDKTSDDYRTEILSDTLQIISDVIKYLKNEDWDYGVLQDQNCIPFVQKFVDYCAGWYADIEIDTVSNNNPCNIPE